MDPKCFLVQTKSLHFTAGTKQDLDVTAEDKSELQDALDASLAQSLTDQGEREKEEQDFRRGIELSLLETKPPKHLSTRTKKKSLGLEHEHISQVCEELASFPVLIDMVLVCSLQFAFNLSSGRLFIGRVFFRYLLSCTECLELRSCSSCRLRWKACPGFVRIWERLTKQDCFEDSL